eukprot:30828-Pelagococcus_subviridis.AAC.19
MLIRLLVLGHPRVPDHAAAVANRPGRVVQHERLTGRDRALRVVEVNLERAAVRALLVRDRAPVRDPPDETLDDLRAVPRLRAEPSAVEAVRKRQLPLDPEAPRHGGGRDEQRRVIRPGGDVHVGHPRARVLPDDEPRRRRAADARALAARVTRETFVRADDGAVDDGDERARRRVRIGRARLGRSPFLGQVLVHELSEVFLSSDEADPPAASSRRHRGRQLRGPRRDRPDFRLRQPPQGKARVSQRLLLHGREKVRLVLLLVLRSVQAEDSVWTAHDFRVVPRAQDVRLHVEEAVLQERTEFDVPVAREVRVRRRRAAVEVPQERLEHRVPVLLHEVDLSQLDPDRSRDRCGVALVLLERALAARLLGFVPVSHQHADDVVPGSLQDPRGDRGVDAAGDADGDLRRRLAGRAVRQVRCDSRRERLPERVLQVPTRGAAEFVDRGGLALAVGLLRARAPSSPRATGRGLRRPSRASRRGERREEPTQRPAHLAVRGESDDKQRKARSSSRQLQEKKHDRSQISLRRTLDARDER